MSRPRLRDIMMAWGLILLPAEIAGFVAMWRSAAASVRLGDDDQSATEYAERAYKKAFDRERSRRIDWCKRQTARLATLRDRLRGRPA